MEEVRFISKISENVRLTSEELAKYFSKILANCLTSMNTSRMTLFYQSTFKLLYILMARWTFLVRNHVCLRYCVILVTRQRHKWSNHNHDSASCSDLFVSARRYSKFSLQPLENCGNRGFRAQGCQMIWQHALLFFDLDSMER